MRTVASFFAVACVITAVPSCAWGASDYGTTAAMGSLAVVPPGGPIMAGVEGASDSGGRSIFLTALYGGLIGAAIGTAVALIEGGNYGRDIGIGAGIGILVGVVLGATNVFGDRRGPYPTTDGLGSTDRDPVIHGQKIALAGSF